MLSQDVGWPRLLGIIRGKWRDERIKNVCQERFVTSATRADDGDSLSWAPSRDSEATGLSIAAEASSPRFGKVVESPRCLRGVFMIPSHSSSIYRVTYQW